MSESRAVYIACASGHNVFTDCLLQPYGDLMRLLGHSQMDFTADDAKKLAYAILDWLPSPSREVAELAPQALAKSGDAIVDEALAMLLARSKLGQEKYGTTLMRNDVHLLDWMRYAIEESLDRTLYMIRAVKDLELLYNDGK